MQPQPTEYLTYCSQSNISRKIVLLIIFLSIFSTPGLIAQISNTGCLVNHFGIDAGLYSNIIEFGSATPAAGSDDWFYSVGAGGPGTGIIDESNPSAIQTLLQGTGDPTYIRRMVFPINSIGNGHLMIDAIWARDNFGGTGAIDPTSFVSSSKNGDDPALWAPGPHNVLGKNDILDVGGYMFRDGPTLSDHLFFAGLINMAEPSGDAYMDFEFFAQSITYTPGSGFTSGGPQLGHTAFTFDPSGNITKVGDFIFNVSLTGGGVIPGIEVRLWASYADYSGNVHPPGFTWGPNFDGPFTGSPFGYASIVPISDNICGIVNHAGQEPLAPPWGTRGTKSNTWNTHYADYSVAELGIDMTDLGIDHPTLLGADLCIFPEHTFIVKTRSSAAFTSALKDFAGPFTWGQASMTTSIVGNTPLSCSNPSVTLTASPIRADATYLWTTANGRIESNPAVHTITISQPGTYTLHTILLSTGCSIPDVSQIVGYDPLKPLFNTISATSTLSCSGNNGSINLSVSGGTPPLAYLWSNGATVQNPTGLAPGTYSVTVTDANGCTKALSGVVVAAGTPTTINLSQTPTSCYGSKDGSVSATVTGKSPFTYSWSNGAISQNISGLPAGTYTLTTTDADGCTQTASIAVTQPAAVSLSLVKVSNTLPRPGGNGTITLTVSGGTPAYTFAWTRTGGGFTATTQNLANLTAGVYTVVVTDANGCTATTSTTIYEPEICNDGIDNDGNGFIDCADGTCIPPAPGAITPSLAPVCVGATGVTYSVPNTAGYTYTWTVPSGASITSGQGTSQITVNWISNSSGQICVSATTQYGCVSSTSTCYTVVLQEIPPQPGTIIKN